MCGIAGWYRRGGRIVSPSTIKTQCDRILHRGPDDEGLLIDGDFGFGMRRLSILDIAGGHQPMTCPLGRYSIVFNGEIYNHLDLRAALEKRGYPFRTHSDTETILAAFTIWGHDSWTKLEGMFAIAIWDRLARCLTLVRDPLGIKPLYITEQDGGIAFASELKALRDLPGHVFDIDERAVDDYFSFGHVRKPRSIYRQVSTLEPGHFATIPADGPTVKQAFWRPAFREGDAVSSSEWTERMQSMLLESVGRHMQSDVPVGAFLSGGIDSSAVLAAMVRQGGRSVKAFTIGYPGAGIDETAAASEIARHLGCDHIVLPLEQDRALDVLPQVQRCYDEPFADMAAIPTWYASKLAAGHVKVVLCGEGGDELFAGYKRHRNAQTIRRMRPIMGAVGPFVGMVGHFPVTRSSRINYLRQHAQRLGEFIRLPDGYQQFFAATQISRCQSRQQLYSGHMKSYLDGTRSYVALEEEYFSSQDCSLPPLEQFLLADLTLNMPSAMLTRLDRASMAHSVEARVPFLSHTFVDWALTVPSGLKLRGNVGKAILRDAISPWLPPSVLKRPKQGFQMPLAAWFRGGFGRFAEEIWNDSGLANAGYLDRDAVSRLFAEHRAGEANHSRMLYAIAVFGLWWMDSILAAKPADVAA